MIRLRSCTRRVPSYPTRTRSSSQPPCSARSTSIRVTALRECSREISILEYSYSTPGRSARRCSMRRCFVELMHVLASLRAHMRHAGHRLECRAHCVGSIRSLLLVGGHVVERLDDLAGELALLDGQRLAQLGGGAGPDDRRGHTRPVAHPGERDLERGPPEAVGGPGHGLDDALGEVVEVAPDEGGEVWRR